jgi:hypothetical protein
MLLVQGAVVDLALLSAKHKDRCPPRFRQLPKNLNAGSLKDDFYLCVKQGPLT